MPAAVREFVLRSRPLVAVAVLAWLAVAAPAAATQITVTTTEEEMTNDGDCSLREAFRAANANTARDACPAGSSASSDTIVLAADAVYALTIPPSGTNDSGATGALVVLSNPATTDLQITVAGGGVATISQDAVPDDRVLVLANGVSVGIDGVTIENGTLTTASARGAGILTGSGSRLVLSNCGIRQNRSLDSGGGIRSGGELIIQDSSFDSNFTSGSGGAISTGTGSSLIVDGTRFANNVASGAFSDGGAIESTEQMSITDSTFVNNLAKTSGGAIAHFDDVPDMASISQSCFVGNAAGVTGNAVDVFFGSEDLAAGGNWWGAVNGPSGQGVGGGDGVGQRVDFSAFEVQPHAGCLPFELVGNGGFQAGFDSEKIPDRWTSSFLGANDGRACGETGACVVKIRGNGAVKRLAHTIVHAGAAGDAFTFKARSRAKDVPNTSGAYQAILTINHVDGSKQTVNLTFSTGKHGFERKTKAVVASEPYTSMQVAIEYGKVGGLVRFDSVSLLLESQV